MRPTLCALLITIPTIAIADEDQPRGVIILSQGSVTDFEPEWDDSEFNIGAYFDNLHPDAAVWYQHVQTLANPWLGGRQPDTRGDELAAEYISWHFDKAGLEPAFGEGPDAKSWRQPFTFSLGDGIEVHDASMTIGDVVQRRGEDFDVLSNSGSGQATLPLSFVGYGIEDGPDGYSTFSEDDDLTGRAALLLRYEPLDEDGSSKWSSNGFSTHSTIRSKMGALHDRGAAAIILVNPVGAVDGKDGLESPDSSAGFRPTLNVPVLHVTAETANDLLDHTMSGFTLESLQTAANAGGMGVMHAPNDKMIAITTDVGERVYDTHNIGGVIPGRGDLADQWVIIGGHYDHIGHGYTGSRAPGDSRVHPGADDNASGVATILVLADRLARTTASDDRPRRSALFVAFSGEEAGLHGSRHFIDEPSMDLDDANFMLNLDMMGRIRGHQVALNGTGTAEEFDEMLPRLVEPSGLTVSATPSGLGPSDHSNFYRAGVPVLFFFTGLHDDYHTPEDLAWRVNPEGTLDVIDLSETILDEVMHDPNRLTWLESTSGTQARSTGSKVRLGIMPSYSNTDNPGVLIDGVIEGTSAFDAGLLEGDVITVWDDHPIEGGRDLMERLRTHKPNDVVVLTVTRKGSTIKVPVTLKGRGE